MFEMLDHRKSTYEDIKKTSLVTASMTKILPH